jgi:hypothetical protein
MKENKKRCMEELEDGKHVYDECSKKRPESDSAKIVFFIEELRRHSFDRNRD